MNYHIMIDHWLIQDFIDTAEQIAPGKNRYVFTFDPKGKHVHYQAGIYAAYGSLSLNKLVASLNENDRLYIHWFQNPVANLISHLKDNVSLYLLFWGGDFVGQTEKFRDFNFDPLTKAFVNPSLNEKKKKPVRFFNFFNSKNNEDVLVRKKFLQRLDFFCHWNVDDFEIIKETYGGDPRFLNFFYDPKISKIEPLINDDKSSQTEKIIWLGNSDASTNNHLDAIDALSRYASEDIMVYCPLSYGFENEYADAVVQRGINVFGDKWNSIREFSSVEEYFRLQQKSSVVVMYHNRTQAAGNVAAFIRMGKKVFLKRQSSLFTFLTRNGIKVFDSNTIKDLTFDELVRPLTIEEKQNNIKTIGDLFGQETKSAWYRNLLQ